MTKAQEFSELLDDDGQRWETGDGQTFDALLSKFKARPRYSARGIAGAPVRYVFDDGSAITVVGGAWDIGYRNCFCWAGVGHDDECTDPAFSGEYTAEIDGVGPHSSVHDNAGAVDATIYLDDEEIGQVTLLPDPDGKLITWGAFSNWANPQLIDFLAERGRDGQRDLIDSIVAAVHKAKDAYDAPKRVCVNNGRNLGPASDLTDDQIDWHWDALVAAMDPATRDRVHTRGDFELDNDREFLEAYLETAPCDLVIG